MKTLQFFKAGKILSTHGLDGGIIIAHTLNAGAPKDVFAKIPHIFIELKADSFVPYFIEHYKKLSQEEVWLQLEDVPDVETARTLSGKNIWLDEALFQKINPQTISESLVGYTIIDEKAGRIGPVEDLFETPGQVLASVIYQDKEVLIPLIDSTLKRIDHYRKEIAVRLPDGLLDVYE